MSIRHLSIHHWILVILFAGLVLWARGLNGRVLYHSPRVESSVRRSIETRERS